MIFESFVLAMYLSGNTNTQLMNTNLKIGEINQKMNETLSPNYASGPLGSICFNGKTMFDFENGVSIENEYLISKNLQRCNIAPKWNIFYLNFDIEHKVDKSIGGFCFKVTDGSPLLDSKVKAKVESYNTLIGTGIYLNKKFFKDNFNLYSKGEIGYSFSNYSFEYTSDVEHENFPTFGSFSFDELSTCTTRLELGFNFKVDSDWDMYGVRVNFKIGMLSYQKFETITKFKPVNVKNYISGEMIFISNNISFKLGVSYYCMHPETPWEPSGKPGIYDVNGFNSSKLDESRLEIGVGLGYRFKN